jgi:predicted dehydrogenase
VTSVDLGAWTTSRYAALCAACSADPARALETAREYGLPDEAARRLVADHFTDRFDRDPAEQELWERLVQQFRERLVRRTT